MKSQIYAIVKFMFDANLPVVRDYGSLCGIKVFGNPDNWLIAYVDNNILGYNYISNLSRKEALEMPNYHILQMKDSYTEEECKQFLKVAANLGISNIGSLTGILYNQACLMFKLRFTDRTRMEYVHLANSELKDPQEWEFGKQMSDTVLHKVLAIYKRYKVKIPPAIVDSIASWVAMNEINNAKHRPKITVCLLLDDKVINTLQVTDSHVEIDKNNYTVTISTYNLKDSK